MSGIQTTGNKKHKQHSQHSASSKKTKWNTTIKQTKTCSRYLQNSCTHQLILQLNFEELIMWLQLTEYNKLLLCQQNEYANTCFKRLHEKSQTSYCPFRCSDKFVQFYMCNMNVFHQFSLHTEILHNTIPLWQTHEQTLPTLALE